MKTIYHSKNIIAIFLLAAVLVGLSFIWREQARAASLPVDTCIYDSGSNTRTCELWATTGTLSLPGGMTTTIWGYSSSDPALGGVATLPGPAIIANQGEILQVNLHNTLGEATALLFLGQDMIPDLAGVPAGGSGSYVFTLVQPGTFMYEAGLTSNAQHQVALGMFGALIVRPAGLPSQAYPDSATAFTDEALVILSEIDTALNNSADPTTFDMRNYDPDFWFINGKTFPETDVITSTAGVTSTVLLRYINAGLQTHTMNLLGLDQVLLGVDGSQLPYSRHVVANTLVPGQTADLLVHMPEVAPAGGGSYALYDGSFLAHNNNAGGFGGMLTFINISDGTPPATGPATGAVSLTPNPTNGTVDVTIQATITGASTITAAEYFTGTQGVDGTGIMMSALDGAFDTQVETVVATLTITDLMSLPAGDHTIFVHGMDSIWGSANFGVLHLDKLGPMTDGIVLMPNPSNGNLAVNIQATGDETMTGGSDVVAAEYMIDDMGGMGIPMTVSPIAPIASLNATIPITTMQGLLEGEHMLSVRSQDAFGQWGEFMMAALKVDKTGPAAQGLTLTPSVLTVRRQVRVNVTLNDLLTGVEPFMGVQSNVQKAEGFINAIGADGTGFPLTPIDGLFNSPTEKAYAIIPYATINQLPPGENTIFVHGKDSSGNWGAHASAILTIVTDDIFADGFETGDFSQWSGSTGTASVTAAAAHSGAYGMQVNLNGNTPGYVTDNTPAGELTYHGRFYFNPNSMTTGASVPNIFVGLTGSNQFIFRLQFNVTNTGVYRVRAAVNRAGGVTSTPWCMINNGWNAIEIAWQSAASASFQLYTNGALCSSLSALNTSAYQLQTVRLGFSGGISSTVVGIPYFDDFVSKRTQYIGP